MTHFIELGGQERPVCFDQTLGYEYERTMQRSYLRDLEDLFLQIAQVGHAIGTDDVGTAAANMSVVKLVDLIYCAMRLGYRREKLTIDFDSYDVADWILPNQEAIAQLSVWLVESNIDTSAQQADPDAAKKKTMQVPLKAIRKK